MYSFGRSENCKSNPYLLVCRTEISGRSPLSSFLIASRCWRYPGAVLKVPYEYTPGFLKDPGTNPQVQKSSRSYSVEMAVSKKILRVKNIQPGV